MQPNLIEPAAHIYALYSTAHLTSCLVPYDLKLVQRRIERHDIIAFFYSDAQKKPHLGVCDTWRAMTHSFRSISYKKITIYLGV